MSKQEFESVMSQFEEFLNQPTCEFCSEFCGNSWCYNSKSQIVLDFAKQNNLEVIELKVSDYENRVKELVDSKKL